MLSWGLQVSGWTSIGLRFVCKREKWSCGKRQSAWDKERSAWRCNYTMGLTTVLRHQMKLDGKLLDLCFIWEGSLLRKLDVGCSPSILKWMFCISRSLKRGFIFFVSLVVEIGCSSKESWMKIRYAAVVHWWILKGLVKKALSPVTPTQRIHILGSHLKWCFPFMNLDLWLLKLDHVSMSRSPVNIFQELLQSILFALRFAFNLCHS
jgi:hypothetical protein